MLFQSQNSPKYIRCKSNIKEIGWHVDDAHLILPGKVSLSQGQDLPYHQRSPLCNGFYRSGYEHLPSIYPTKDARLPGLEIYLETSSIPKSACHILKDSRLIQCLCAWALCVTVFLHLEHQQVSNERCNCQQGAGSGCLQTSISWNRDTTPLSICFVAQMFITFFGDLNLKDSKLCPSSIAGRVCLRSQTRGKAKHSKLWVVFTNYCNCTQMFWETRCLRCWGLERYLKDTSRGWLGHHIIEWKFEDANGAEKHMLLHCTVLIKFVQVRRSI